MVFKIVDNTKVPSQYLQSTGMYKTSRERSNPLEN